MGARWATWVSYPVTMGALQRLLKFYAMAHLCSLPELQETYQEFRSVTHVAQKATQAQFLLITPIVIMAKKKSKASKPKIPTAAEASTATHTSTAPVANQLAPPSKQPKASKLQGPKPTASKSKGPNSTASQPILSKSKGPKSTASNSTAPSVKAPKPKAPKPKAPESNASSASNGLTRGSIAARSGTATAALATTQSLPSQSTCREVRFAVVVKLLDILTRSLPGTETPMPVWEDQSVGEAMSTRQLPYDQEDKLAKELAFLSRISDSPRHIMAVCVQELPEQTGCEILVAVNKSSPGRAGEVLETSRVSLQRVCDRLREIAPGEFTEIPVCHRTKEPQRQSELQWSLAVCYLRREFHRNTSDLSNLHIL